MTKSLRWTIAWTLAGVLPVLTACSTSPPSPRDPMARALEIAQAATYQARDYYFPSSATMRATYNVAISIQVPPPNQSQSFSTTGRMTLEVLNYSPTSATLQATTTTTDPSGQQRTNTTTTSLTVEPDGTVVSQNGGTERHSNRIFTSMGDLVAPASGSEIPAIRGRLIGTEAVTVPAGTYQTVHLQEGPGDPNAPQTDLWLARGVGIVRQRMDATLPAQGQGQGQNQGQQVRTSIDIQLQSFTP